MILKVTGNNERLHYPDLGDNLKQDIENQFAIKVRKLSLSIHSDKWMKSVDDDEDGSRISINLRKYVRAHLVGFINPPMLKDGKKEFALDANILFSDEYDELYPIIEGLLSYIQDMYEDGEEESIKK